MEIKLLEVTGWLGVLSALRKPFKGGLKSVCNNTTEYRDNTIFTSSTIFIHDEDIKLMSKLVKAGNEHAKCIRGLIVYADFDLPRYIWSEMDTYRIGKECLSSESTMHTILNEKISIDNFESIDDNVSDLIIEQFIYGVDVVKSAEVPNSIKKRSIKTMLPESYLQKRTLMISYQALRKIYFERKGHELPQWKIICNWIEDLPYAKEVITIK